MSEGARRAETDAAAAAQDAEPVPPATPGAATSAGAAESQDPCPGSAPCEARRKRRPKFVL